MRISTQKNLKYIVMPSLLVAMFLYIVSMMFYLDTYVNERELEFKNFSTMLTQYNQILYFTGVTLESEIEFIDEVVQEEKQEIIETNSQSSSNYDLKNIDMKIEKEFQRLVSQMPATISEQDVVYYCSYVSSMILVDKPHSMATNEGCENKRNFALEASERQLSDRILISDPFNIERGRDYITVSSPVYFQGNIIGDVNVDMYVSQFKSDTKVRVEKDTINGTTFYNIIYGNKYNDVKFAYTIDYVADNSTVYVYKMPLLSVLYKTLTYFFILWLICAYVMYLYKERGINKLKLSEAESNVAKDQMTQLHNRKVLDNEDFVYNIEENGATILAIDGNKLKTMNDTYGHHVGDEAIKNIANAMKLVFRDTDYLIRTGGDEFMVVLPGCKFDNASRLAARLKEAVLATTFSPYALNISVSVGIAEMMESEPLQSAIRRADEKLYEDKLSK